MKKLLLVMVLLVGLFFGGGNRPALGGQLRADGNELLEACSLTLSDKNKDSLERTKSSYCIGFVTGFIRSLTIYEVFNSSLGYQNIICPPDAPLGQHVRIVYKYLQDHPKELHMNEGVLVYQALREAFPCPKK